MMRSVTQPSRSCQGIQCGMARMSIEAKTGSPRSPRSSKWRHVLIHGQRDAGVVAQPDDFDRLRVINSKRLLSEDAFDMASLFDSGFHNIDLNVRRDGDVDDFDLRISEQLFVVVVDFRDRMPIRSSLSRAAVS
jgi:hypothetical protein